MDSIKIIYKSLYNKYGKKTKQIYQTSIITNLISSKNCRSVALLKDSMIYDFIDEFLKRYFKKKESKIQIPKLVNYYKNYLRFFCKPTFRHYSLNNIIQHNGEKLAEVYYNNNYGKNSKNKNNDNKKDNKKKVPNQFKIIFSDTVRNSINSISSSILNENSTNKTIQLNQSSFRLLYKNNYGEDFENESLINLINDLNGKKNYSITNQRNRKIIGKKVKNLIRYNSPENDINIKNNDIREFHSQGNEQRNKNYFNKEHIQLIVEQKNKLVIDTLHKERDIKNKLSIINKNYSSDKNKLLNNGKIKLKLKTNPTHFKNILSTQLSPKIILTEVNNMHKRNQGRSSDLSNNNFYQTYYSRTTDNYNYNFNNNNNNNNILNNNNYISYNTKNNFEPYKTGIISLKNKNINKLNKPSSRNLASSKKSNNFITSFNNFEYQQQLLNNGRNLKIKGSFNSSSRNTISNHVFSHTQTFSPQSNRYIKNFKNDKSVNKVYLKINRFGKI